MIGLWKPVDRAIKLEHKGFENQAGHGSCGNFLFDEIEHVALEWSVPRKEAIFDLRKRHISHTEVVQARLINKMVKFGVLKWCSPRGRNILLMCSDHSS